MTHHIEEQTRELIDKLKNVCAHYGLGNDGNEFKIITQVFLYKFLNDKFAYETKRIDVKLAESDNWEETISEMSDEEYELLQFRTGANTAWLKPKHFISYLFRRQNDDDFAKLFDKTLIEISALNNNIFAVHTEGGAKIVLFDRISEYISDEAKRNDFCRALINKLVDFSFENVFSQKYDFFASIFEYLIKDYNKDSGGKYAEYYTPHAVAKIMAAILVPEEYRDKVTNVSCYDPSAGSGTLLMNLAHSIGEQNCFIYSQDISQKSSSLLRLNLVLNNLVHSIPNIIQGNTLLNPSHKDGSVLKKFDYIVSNPPFKMDFSDFRNALDTRENHERFFAGIPSIPAKKMDGMAIYQLFLQHIIYSLKPGGKAAVVVPTGFITAQTGIDKKIRKKLIDDEMLAGVVSMPGNIFSNTPTSVSIIFIDDSNKGKVILIDASNLGTKVKEGKNQKTVLTRAEEDKITLTFNSKESKSDFSVLVSYNEISQKNYSLCAGQYFDIKLEHVDISPEEFNEKLSKHLKNLNDLFSHSRLLEEEIKLTSKELTHD